MKNSTLLLTILILFTSISCAQTLFKHSKIADEIVASALKEKKAYNWLNELCKIGPRLSGSQNLDSAVNWAKNKIESLGFDVWLQPVMVPHWERGNVESAKIALSSIYNGRELSITALGGSIGTPADGITAEVLEVKSIQELEEKKDMAKGKIIFFSRPMDASMVNKFEAYESTVDQRSRGAIEAGRYGGVAALVRSITTKHDNVPHTGAMRKYDPQIAAVPGAALGYLDADFLSDALKKDPHLKITINLSCKTYPDVQSFNIIADLKGIKFPDEYVVVGGHFDSWDVGQGAHDNGGGCMQALEVLDIFTRLNIKPSRTIRCILFANEENGVRGGITYGQYSDSLKINHTAAIESDRGVFSPRGFYFEMTPSDSAAIMKKVTLWLPILKKAGIEWIKQGHGGVDIGKIKNAGALIGFSPVDQRYFDFHHSANDVFEAVNAKEMELGSAAIAILAYLISEEEL